jgi:peptidoglycan/LPS O-acetylase OafA/YrhL
MTKYWNQLDGLRGLAIFGVIYAHFVTPHVDFVVPLGSWGVRLFFVLSGFLITGILLRVKTEIERGDQSLGYTLKVFYIRRSLRIFTIFYLWNFAMYFAGYPYGDGFWWHIFYLTNWYQIIFNEGRVGAAGHFWSLAVEEQFYLVWPLLILVVRGRHLKSLFVSVIVASMVIRVVMAVNGVDYLKLKQNTILCFDALAMGALLASSQQAGKVSFDALIGILKRLTILFGVPVMLACLWWVNSGGKSIAYAALMHASCAVCFGFVVGGAIRGFSGFSGSILSWKWLGYIGRVSYCIYIIHLFVPSIIRKVEEVVGVSVLEIHWGIDAAIVTVVSIVIALASWRFIESPVNSLKNRFPMRKVNSQRAE